MKNKLNELKNKNFFIMVLIISLGLGSSYYLLQTKPKAKSKEIKHISALVSVQDLNITNVHSKIEALGRIVPAQRVDLSPRVSGEIQSISYRLIPGAQYEKGDFLARIDPRDFRLSIRQRKAELVKAEFDLELEKGKRAIAKREYEMLGESIKEEDRAMVLREPHLRAAQANVDAARASVSLAVLNLDRTRINAPFNGIVQDTSLAVGMQVSSSTKIISFVSTDVYWIDASIPVNKLALVNYKKGNASSVFIEPRSPGQVFPKGTVKTIKSDVEDKGRMARVIIEVKNPLTKSIGAPLLLGDLLKIKISGKTLPNVLVIPRNSLREGSEIWLLTEENTLDIQKIKVLWSDRKYYYALSETIKRDEKLIYSHLASAVNGMSLRTKENLNAQ